MCEVFFPSHHRLLQSRLVLLRRARHEDDWGQVRQTFIYNLLVVAQGTQAHEQTDLVARFVWNIIASLVRKLKMTINSQLSLDIRSYIVLVFLVRFKAFQQHFIQSNTVNLPSAHSKSHQNGKTKCPFS